jgi:5-methylcytosine-specific restriction protein A
MQIKYSRSSCVGKVESLLFALFILQLLIIAVIGVVHDRKFVIFNGSWGKLFVNPMHIIKSSFLMPQRTPKACRVRGCRHTTTDPSGYCESHKSEGWKQYKPGQSRHQRGYGSKWDAIRERVLKRDKGLCQLCLRVSVVREAKTVDHIIPKAHGGTDADCNLQSLCWPCHKAKTARERLK